MSLDLDNSEHLRSLGSKLLLAIHTFLSIKEDHRYYQETENVMIVFSTDQCTCFKN